ncbi:MAG TPA: hypothetical protein VGC37_15975 [Friedmanniella sp.]
MPSAEGESPETLVRRAEDAAAKLKVGTWESVQALALLSIAKSLAAGTTEPAHRDS